MSKSQKENKRLKEFDLAIEYWEKISNNQRLQFFNRYIEGFSNFDLTKIPLPTITYSFLAPIHRSKWPIYVAAFNYLYGFRHAYYSEPKNRINIPDINTFFLQYRDQIVSSLILKEPVWHKILLTKDNIPVGMADVYKNFNRISFIIPYLTYIKQCKICGETKITYCCPITKEKKICNDDVWIEHLITILKENHKKLSLQSWHFKHNYNSKDGWGSVCGSCLKLGLLPSNWTGQQLFRENLAD